MALEINPATVDICDPASLTDGERAQIENVLRAGRAVHVPSAMSEIPFAPALAIARHDGKIVGVGAIKRPRPSYAKKKQNDAKCLFDAQTAELGYVAIDTDYRDQRLSGRIADKLLAAYSGPLFATTDDKKMKSTLGNRGFQQKGGTWEGERGILSLWLRDGVQGVQSDSDGS
jgi:hypothetical protein